MTSGTPEPRAVLNIEEGGLARSGRKATGRPWNPQSGTGEDCWQVNTDLDRLGGGGRITREEPMEAPGDVDLGNLGR